MQVTIYHGSLKGLLYQDMDMNTGMGMGIALIASSLMFLYQV
jgi:hypothetical protein